MYKANAKGYIIIRNVCIFENIAHLECINTYILIPIIHFKAGQLFFYTYAFISIATKALCINVKCQIFHMLVHNCKKIGIFTTEAAQSTHA